MKATATIWVSACLLGQPVRYDGDHKAQGGLAEWLAGWAEPVALCPEVFAGLGTPRPPIQRQYWQGGERLVLAANGAPAASQLPEACARLVAASGVPAGAILKARSPSCGAGTSPLFDTTNQRIETGDGVFVQALRAAYPDLPIADEESIATPQQRTAFVDQVMERMKKIGKASSPLAGN